MRKSEEELKIQEDILAGRYASAFHTAYNTNLINTFLEIIEDNDLQGQFTQNLFDSLIELSSNEKEKRRFFEVSSRVALDHFGEVYGEELKEKLEKAYKEKRIDFLDIAQIGILDTGKTPHQQGAIIGKILDLYKDGNHLVGLHRTGGACEGEIINSEGLYISGHLSSGVDFRGYSDIETELDQNISFEKRPGIFTRSVATGGNYKNLFNQEYVDIAIISIPKEELKKTRDVQDVIIEDETQSRLNPKYVKGYITVNSRDNTMVEYVENPRYIEQSIQKNNTDHNQNEPKKGEPNQIGDRRAIFNVHEIGNNTARVNISLKDMAQGFITRIRESFQEKER